MRCGLRSAFVCVIVSLKIRHIKFNKRGDVRDILFRLRDVSLFPLFIRKAMTLRCDNNNLSKSCERLISAEEKYRRRGHHVPTAIDP